MFDVVHGDDVSFNVFHGDVYYGTINNMVRGFIIIIMDAAIYCRIHDIVLKNLLVQRVVTNVKLY